MTGRHPPGTAEVRRQGPHIDSKGRARREFGYHAVAIGNPPDLLPAEAALCGAPGPWEQAPDGLFAAPLGCERCAWIATHNGITILGLPDTEPARRPSTSPTSPPSSRPNRQVRTAS
jgi:hypothetical protein